MKKLTKQKILVLVLAITMTFSVFGYAFLSAFPSYEQQTKLLDSFIIKEKLSEDVKEYYISLGFTVFEFYYNKSGETFLGSIEELPNQFTTLDNKIQIIIEEIPNEKTYVILTSLNGEEEINITEISDVAEPLCKIIMYKPFECLNVSS